MIHHYRLKAHPSVPFMVKRFRVIKSKWPPYAQYRVSDKSNRKISKKVHLLHDLLLELDPVL